MESLNLKSKIICSQIIEAMKGEQYLKVEIKYFLPLTVELLDTEIWTPFGIGNSYSFCHYYEQNGDLMQAPEMCFILVDNRDDQNLDWDQVFIFPFMYQYAATCAYELSIITDGNKVTRINRRLQVKHALLAEQWMHEIKSIGFLKKLWD
ncbi:DUF6908 domain-containing protein [Sphingobacterium faecium]|uniref:DUF6908 domain-containing protein n=1 Tax=Sphingobacterium faecium TaxID=34087 RepID=UPI003209581D